MTCHYLVYAPFALSKLALFRKYRSYQILRLRSEPALNVVEGTPGLHRAIGFVSHFLLTAENAEAADKNFDIGHSTSDIGYFC